MYTCHLLGVCNTQNRLTGLNQLASPFFSSVHDISCLVDKVVVIVFGDREISFGNSNGEKINKFSEPWPLEITFLGELAGPFRPLY
jgi:hypothetical protein